MKIAAKLPGARHRHHHIRTEVSLQASPHPVGRVFDVAPVQLEADCRRSSLVRIPRRKEVREVSNEIFLNCAGEVIPMDPEVLGGPVADAVLPRELPLTLALKVNSEQVRDGVRPRTRIELRRRELEQRPDDLDSDDRLVLGRVEAVVPKRAQVLQRREGRGHAVCDDRANLVFQSLTHDSNGRPRHFRARTEGACPQSEDEGEQ